MRRRDVLALFGGAGAAIVRPQDLIAQQEPIRPLIGLLSPLSQSAAARNIAAFRSAMRDLGYVEGRTMCPNAWDLWRASWSRSSRTCFTQAQGPAPKPFATPRGRFQLS
jgi:hypothetical protein